MSGVASSAFAAFVLWRDGAFQSMDRAAKNAMDTANS
jgi:hypothetical protein